MKTLLLCLCAAIVCALTLTYPFPGPAAGRSAAAPAVPLDFGSLPVSFERNDGQAPAGVRYVARGPGYTTYLMDKEAVLVIAKSSVRSKSPARESGKRPSDAAAEPQVIRMSLVGANPAPEVYGVGKLPGDANYFVGKDPAAWRTSIPTFGKVQYEGVFPGIDLTYYGKQGQLEFDLTVAPGADPGLINLSYEGVEGLSLAEGGALALKTRAGQILQDAPVIYQEEGGRRVRVEGEYVLRGDGGVGFRVREYDRAKPLIIDPVIKYSTLLGGTGGEAAFGLAVDSAGNSYVTGVTTSADFPVVSPAQGTYAGVIRDVFVTKINPSGSAILYSTYLGGAGDEQGVDIAVNPAGDAYVTGWTTSTNFPVAAPFQNAYGGGQVDAFLARLGPAGNSLVYSTYAGGSGDDVGSGVAVDGAGNIYGIGYTTSTNLQVVNALQPTKGSGADAYVVKTNPAGDSIIYSTYLGGNGDDFGNGIAVDGAGNAYGIGDTRSSDLSTVNGVQTSNAGGFDAYLAKLSADGRTLLYGTYAGGSSDDFGSAVALDSSNNVYAAGFTNSGDIFTFHGMQNSLRGGTDGYFAKLNVAGGGIIYASYYGGERLDVINDIAVDAAGNLYLTGWTDSTQLPLDSPVQPVKAGERDVFLSKLNPEGNQYLYTTYLGGVGIDVGWGVGVDGQGNAYVAGQTLSGNFPVAGALQPLRGSSDAFVTKVSTEAGPALPPYVQFDALSYTIQEVLGEVTVTVLRLGDTSVPVSVGYATRDGSATDKSDYTASFGTVSFAPGQSVARIKLPIADDRLLEGDEFFILSLVNPSGATLGAGADTAAIVIQNNDTVNGPSPVRWDSSFNITFFVRQHYADFLSRVPDPSGFQFWFDEIGRCNFDQQCREVKFVNVSAAFFLSIEFQETGYHVYRTYKAAYGDATSPNVEGTVPVVRLREHQVDTQRIGSGVEVGIGNWQQRLEANKSAYALEFVQRPRFLAAYPAALTPAQFVDGLNSNAGLVLTQAERDQLVAQLTADNTNAGRASVLRAVAENGTLRQREFNRAFVLMQYFGYLRRNPDDAPEVGRNYAGWKFWLGKLDENNGNYVQAEMVKAFLLSTEYQQRFGQ